MLLIKHVSGIVAHAEGKRQADWQSCCGVGLQRIMNLSIFLLKEVRESGNCLKVCDQQ